MVIRYALGRLDVIAVLLGQGILDSAVRKLILGAASVLRVELVGRQSGAHFLDTVVDVGGGRRIGPRCQTLAVAVQPVVDVLLGERVAFTHPAAAVHVVAV